MEDSRTKKLEDCGRNIYLPPEIMRDIFSRLPVKPLCRFRCVSKAWRSLISDPDFVENYSKAGRRLLFTCLDWDHHWLYSLNLDKFLNENHNVGVNDLVADPTELDFVYNHLPNGGLDWRPFVHYSGYDLFLSELCSGDFSISLINPVTKESKRLPEPPIWRLPREPLNLHKHLCGVGFVDSTNEYKVINGQDYGDGIVFSVYTLQTRSWRQIDNLFPYRGLDYDGILVNGAVHWLVTKVIDGSLTILSFLLAEEEVTEIALPPNLHARAANWIRLGAFRNSLCITSTVVGNAFWVMKEYGVRESWTQMRVCIPYYELSHSGFWTESHDLMVFNRSSFVMYNFSDDKFWTLSIGKVVGISSIGIYVETLPSFCLNSRIKNKCQGKDDKDSIEY